MSKRCSGRTKFNAPCTRYVLEDKCWEHVTEAKQQDALSGYEELIGQTLNSFTRDKENVHTKPIQSGVERVIHRLLEWGKDILTSPDLPEEVLSAMTHEPTTTQISAYNHLRECYDINDDVELFHTTYPRLCTLVWRRASSNEHLVARFFEEVSESVGLCLNGNMARLANVFAGIDQELSVQEVFLSKEQLQHLICQSMKLEPIECMEKVLELCKQAGLTNEETQTWIQHISIFYYGA